MAIANKNTVETPPTLSADPEIEALLLNEKIKELEDVQRKRAIDPSKKLFILREIRIDSHNVRRYRAELTPSMCRVRGCNFDAATAMGIKNGWKEAPLEQMLSNGKKVKDRILDLLKVHTENGHVIETSHIMDEDELNIQKRAASLPKPFLTTV